MRLHNSKKSNLLECHMARWISERILLTIYLSIGLSSSGFAFIPIQPTITSAQDIPFYKLTSNTTTPANNSDFSIALQSRILNLLTQQLIENTHKKYQTSFSDASVRYKTHAFVVNISPNIENNIRIEIRDHGASTSQIVEITPPK